MEVPIDDAVGRRRCSAGLSVVVPCGSLFLGSTHHHRQELTTGKNTQYNIYNRYNRDPPRYLLFWLLPKFCQNYNEVVSDEGNKQPINGGMYVVMIPCNEAANNGAESFPRGDRASQRGQC